jgi:hypothetical protein
MRKKPCDNYDNYDEKENPKININKRIQEAKEKIEKDNSKYNLGPKRYEYDFIDNEQPIVGLSPDYEQNYPSTLKKSNKMIVDQDLSTKYINLLNTKNNSLKTYNNS